MALTILAYMKYEIDIILSVRWKPSIFYEPMPMPRVYDATFIHIYSIYTHTRTRVVYKLKSLVMFVNEFLAFTAILLFYGSTYFHGNTVFFFSYPLVLVFSCFTAQSYNDRKVPNTHMYSKRVYFTKQESSSQALRQRF